jgi:23S rRNA pseudouridine2605 synthase
MSNDTIKDRGAARKPEGAKKTGAKRPPRKPLEDESSHEGERIAKVMARAGLCSRRDAEAWILEGRVSVNGEKLASAALNVTDGDRVTVDGRPLATRERTRLFLFHKPRGLVTTDRDPEGRPTVFDYIAEKFPALPRLMSVGRLDINTEGLLLLTNDGGLSRVLELPSTGWLRRYRARANGKTDQAQLDTLARGVTIDGVDYAGVEARLDRVQGANVWITLGLREGKNREVKRLLEHLMLGVNRLIRTSYGPFQLGEMAEGAVEEVKTRILADQLGAGLAKEANVDFDGPVFDRTPEPEPEFVRGPRGKKPDERSERGERTVKKSFASQEKPEPRKHVSALRGDRVKAEKGPRRRTERAATEDRNGRKVAVERVSTARRAEAPPYTRNARRFREEREKTDAREKPFAAERKSAPRSERPAGAAGAAKTFRGARGEAAEARPQRGERPSFARGGARDEAHPRGPRKDFGERPSKDGERPRPPAKSFGERFVGGKPFGERPAGGKPFGGRPSGHKPFGERPSGERPSRGIPSGGKPSSRPSGSSKPRGK